MSEAAGIAGVLRAHEADVTSYDARDIWGCRCGFELSREQRRSDDYGWEAYRAHVAAAVLDHLRAVAADEAVREAVARTVRPKLDRWMPATWGETETWHRRRSEQVADAALTAFLAALGGEA